MTGATLMSTPSVSSPWIRITAYFASGWAFFIPYLVAYLAYAVAKWPVNPSAASFSTASLFNPPALLHVYWFLHAAHLVAGAGVLWKATASRLPRGRSNMLQRLVPWVLIGLVLWLPGTYLEFPADPWEHLRRINEWAWHETVGQHTYWTKSTYFVTFSVIGRAATFRTQVAYLDVVQTVTGLLLSWQYYRLARVTGLSQPGAMLVAIVHLLVAGNSVFGFHRYYGVASTEIAHIGALAFIREVIVWCKARTKQVSGAIDPGSTSSAKLAAQTAALVGLVTFSHLQGLGIMAFGAVATLGWWLVERRRSTFLWLALSAIVVSVLVLVAFPHDEIARERLRASGWLAPWYGLNLLSVNSPAGIRTTAILGIFGVVELAAAIWLLFRRNHLVGWLCLTPLLLLSLPAVAIPLVTALMTKGESEILVFHRFLFAIPTGLAAVTFGYTSSFCGLRRIQDSARIRGTLGFGRATLAFSTIVAATLALMLVPPGAPYYNRFWHLIFVPPADQRMSHITAALDKNPASPGAARSSLLLATRAAGFVAAAAGKTNNAPTAGRLIHTAQPSDYLPQFISALDEVSPGTGAVLLLTSPLSIYSPVSFAGYISNHWLPQEAAIYNTIPAERPFGRRWKIPERKEASYAELVPLDGKAAATVPNKTD